MNAMLFEERLRAVESLLSGPFVMFLVAVGILLCVYSVVRPRRPECKIHEVEWVWGRQTYCHTHGVQWNGEGSCPAANRRR